LATAPASRGPALGQRLDVGVAHERREQLGHALVGGGRYEAGLEPAQPEHLPNEVDDVADPDLLERVGGVERIGDARQQLLVAGDVLARDQRR
jgi:hypothetical protein